MPVYLFVWQLLAWSVTVVAFLPLTIPWGVLAYKIWHGAKEIEEDMSEELWSRSWRANLVLLITSPIFIVLDFVAAVWFELPAELVHIVIWVFFVAFVAWMMMFFFSLEDFFQGLLLTTLHVYLPAVTLMLLWWMTRWNPLFVYVLGWLKEPKG